MVKLKNWKIPLLILSLIIYLYYHYTYPDMIRYYSFDNVTVSRIDYIDKSIFIYGKTDKLRDKDKYFEVSYNDFNGGAGLYLIFKTDIQQVEVIRCIGRFNFKHADSCFVETYYSNDKLDNALNTLKNNNSVGIMYLSYIQKNEENAIINFKSRVKVSYE